MMEEPTPPPPIGGDALIEPIVEPPPPPSRPRSPFGWIAAGALVLLLAVSAVMEYATPSSEEKSYESLQKLLEYNVSLDPDIAGVGKSTIAASKKSGLKDVLRKAKEHAGDSEEAARIAVVAALELGEDPPEGALETLVNGKDPESRSIASVFSQDEAPVEDLDALVETESGEFAVTFAKVLAQEKFGREVDRTEVLDTGYVGRLLAVSAGGLVLFILGAAALAVFLYLNSTGRIVAKGCGPLEKSDGDRLVARFAMYFAAFLGVGAVVGSMEGLGIDLESVWTQTLVLTLVLVVVLLLLKVPMLDRSDSARGVMGESRPFWKNVGLGLFGYFCTVPLLIVALGLIGVMTRFLPEPSHPITEEMSKAGPTEWLALALTAAVLAPLVEEIGFRGLLFPALLTQLKKPWVAMVLCGLIFASIHPQGPLAWPALATTGAAAAALRYYTGSLVPAIVLHMVHNAVILGIGFLIG